MKIKKILESSVKEEIQQWKIYFLAFSVTFSQISRSLSVWAMSKLILLRCEIWLNALKKICFCQNSYYTWTHSTSTNTPPVWILPVLPEQSWVCHSRHCPYGKEMTYAEESTQRCVLLHHMHSMAWLVQLAQLVCKEQGVLQGRALWLCGLPEKADKWRSKYTNRTLSSFHFVTV